MTVLKKILHNIRHNAINGLLFILIFLSTLTCFLTADLFSQSVMSTPSPAKAQGGDRKSVFQALMNNASYNYGTHFARTNKRYQRYSYVKKALKDTAKNKIKELREREDNEGYMLFLELEDCNSPIKIAVYNMLGKKVLDIYDGYPNSEPDYYYDIPTDDLPDGIYLCVVQGRGFQLPEKFTVSR